MKTNIYTVLFTVAIFLFSCTKTQKPFSFYHWKSKAKFTTDTEKTLNFCKTKTIYLRYFDIDLVRENDIEIPFPVYSLREVDEGFKKFDIIPTIYITNRTFQSNVNTEILSKKVALLIDQISEHHFKKKFTHVQLDCDWSGSTQEQYFSLINFLSTKGFEVEATIRLHQIKYADKTGVPNIKKGVLMLYNMGELKDMQRNSIIDSKITKQYITDATTYPVPLKIALPLFSQTVIKNNNNNEIKLINNTKLIAEAINNPHFIKTNTNQYKVLKDTLYQGFFLSKGFTMKTENSNLDDLISSYQIIEHSKIITEDIILYHLDDATIEGFDLTQLIERL